MEAKEHREIQELKDALRKGANLAPVDFERMKEYEAGQESNQEDCPICNGEGKVMTYIGYEREEHGCDICNGTGKSNQDRPEICENCPTFEKGCEGSNQEDCARQESDQGNVLIVKGTEHPEERLPLYKSNQGRLRGKIEQIFWDAYDEEQRVRYGKGSLDISPFVAQIKDVLEVARAAILDACYCEDGLDASTGSAVMNWITDLLGDAEEYHPTIEGVSSQTDALKKKALDWADNVIREQERERIRKIYERDIAPFVSMKETARQCKFYQALKEE